MKFDNVFDGYVDYFSILHAIKTSLRYVWISSIKNRVLSN